MADPAALDDTLAALGDAVRRALADADLPDADPGFERPKDPDHGDWASTVALRLAKPAKRNPREIAQAIVDGIELPDGVASVEPAGPGFLNFRFGPSYWRDVVARVVARGEDWGRQTVGDVERINVEFVSANPTGPLHAGAGRWVATGDAIAELLASQGHDVVREYYLNDAGEQVRRFGETVTLVHLGQELGEDHYKGDYVADVAAELVAEHGQELFAGPVGAGADSAPPELAGESMSHDADGELAVDDLGIDDADGRPTVDPAVAARVGVLAVDAMQRHIMATSEALGVHYDVWFSERESLHASGAVDAAIDVLRRSGGTVEQDGALFLRTTEHDDDKDRVLVRSDGRPTYFAADAAYMLDKWGRADRLYYLLGADHHGYVARLQSLGGWLGIPAEALEIRIGQLVNLLRDGEPVRMSKRAGEMITIDEVVEEVGTDVARYHFLRSSLDTTMDLDLARVVRQSTDNPVYYVQYAHARIASLIDKADERGFDAGDVAAVDASLLDQPAELELLRGLAAFPGVVAEAAEHRATQRLTRFAEEYAAEFHRFYTESRILPREGEQMPVELSRARYWLAVAARRVLGNALGLLRVSAPDRM